MFYAYVTFVRARPYLLHIIANDIGCIREAAVTGTQPKGPEGEGSEGGSDGESEGESEGEAEGREEGERCTV